MNQMTTQLLSDQELPTLVPALGESWGYLMNTRVALFWRNRTRWVKEREVVIHTYAVYLAMRSSLNHHR
jgi:hypothetical protein